MALQVYEFLLVHTGGALQSSKLSDEFRGVLGMAYSKVAS